MHVRFEDDALTPAIEDLAVKADQPRQPLGKMQYAIDGVGRYTVREEGDRLATDLSAAAVVDTVTTRCRARVLDHLSLGGWTAIRGAIVRRDGGRVLVVGDDDGAFVAANRAAGRAIEGDDLVFVRAGRAVCLPQPSSTLVAEAPVTSVAVVVDRDGAGAPLDTGQIVEALVTATLPSWTPPAEVLRACVELVGGADGYRVSAPR